MAQFQSYDTSVEVLGDTILAMIHAVPVGWEIRLDFFRMNGIDPREGQWYPQQPCLNAMRAILEQIGEYNLFLVGKGLVHAHEGKSCKGLRQAINALKTFYHQVHRGGETGTYTLEIFDEKQRAAMVVSTTPYPDAFERGILAALVRKYGPEDALEQVLIDRSKPCKREGADSTTFILYW